MLPAELDAPIPEVPNETTIEIFLWVSLLSHMGQTGIRSASEKRTIFSNGSPHLLHSYS